MKVFSLDVRAGPSKPCPFSVWPRWCFGV